MSKGQTKKHMLLESICTTAVGMINAVTLTQLITDIPFTTNIMLTVILTATSILLKYGFRYMFNSITVRQEKKV